MRQLHTQPVRLKDEGGGQVRDRLRHLVQRLVDLREWVLMRWGDAPHPMHMRKVKMRDATRAGCHQDHEIMWAGICTLACI